MPPAGYFVETRRSATPFYDRHNLCLSSDLFKLLRGASKANSTLPVGGCIRETITATAGKCLFLQKPAVSGRTVSVSRLGELLLPRIFTGDIPKITPFLRLLPPFLGSEGRQLHRIRLTPSSIAAGILPPFELEIEIKLGDTRSPSTPDFIVRRATVVLLEKNTDYLLPESGLDLRFTRTVYRDIVDNTENGIPVNGYASAFGGDEPLVKALQGCLESIKFNYGTSKSHIPWPAFCHLRLPREVMTLNPMQQMPHTKESNEGVDYITAEYMFPPLRSFALSRIQLYDFHGERLSYGYHECGPLFAKGTAYVSLEMDAVSGEFADTLLQEFNYFYRTACKMAFELGGVWGKHR
jgi:hypothetical protein